MARKNPQLDALKQGAAERLRLLRGLHGQNLTDFAAAAGIARNTYSQYENATRLPAIEHSLLLCTTYNITLDWLYTGDLTGVNWDLARKIQAASSSTR